MSAQAGPDPEMLERMRGMLQFTPHARAIGVEVTRIEPARAWGRVPYRADLVGDPDTGVIAGGVLVAFLDHVCGAAAMAGLRELKVLATLDLRIDYMRPAQPGRDILAEAFCYKAGASVAFVRATAYEDSADNPIAHAVSAFMINSDGGRRPGANLKAPRP